MFISVIKQNIFISFIFDIILQKLIRLCSRLEPFPKISVTFHITTLSRMIDFRRSSENLQNLKNFKPHFTSLAERYRRGLETCPQAKTSNSGHAFFFFFPTRPSDEHDSAPSQKYSRPLMEVFACIG